MTFDEGLIASLTDKAHRFEGVADCQRELASLVGEMHDDLMQTTAKDKRLADAIDDLRAKVHDLAELTKQTHHTCQSVAARYLATAELCAEILAEDQ